MHQYRVVKIDHLLGLSELKSLLGDQYEQFFK